MPPRRGHSAGDPAALPDVRICHAQTPLPPVLRAIIGGSLSRSTVAGFAASLQLVAVFAATSDSRRGSAFARYARGDAKRLGGTRWQALVPF